MLLSPLERRMFVLSLTMVAAYPLFEMFKNVQMLIMMENALKGPVKYLLMPLLGKSQLAMTLQLYASLGPNLDNTHRGEI